MFKQDTALTLQIQISHQYASATGLIPSNHKHIEGTFVRPKIIVIDGVVCSPYSYGHDPPER